MWEETVDAVKSMFPWPVVVFIPLVFVVLSPSAVSAAQEFKVYRMQQYDLQSKGYGECANDVP